MSHRQNGCDVHLKYAAISRRHATLALQKEVTDAFLPNAVKCTLLPFELVMGGGCAAAAASGGGNGGV